jgi:hypothetical protein
MEFPFICILNLEVAMQVCVYLGMELHDLHEKDNI